MLKSFANGQDLEVGVDVPDKIAEDMLRCDYAIAKKGRPRIETKKEDIKDPKESKDFDIETADADALEAFARKELGLELDKRIKINKLRKQVKDAIKNKPHEGEK